MNLEKFYPIFLHQLQVAAKRIHKLFHYLLSHNYEDCTPLNLSSTLEQWTAFAIDLDKLCPIDPLVFDAWPLNQKCEYLHSRIIKAAKSQLPSITVGNTYALKKPKYLESLCQSYRFLSKVAKTIRSLHKNPTLYSVSFESKWSSYYIRLNQLLFSYKQIFVTPIVLPPSLRDE
ncbi:hypothetical protein GLOIN_2v1786555 [Rhizophagus irregularis DAOM 181602=DAOM 197198]|nr:hypothetical protein GLOIN_2v1786555 [Rhizophagus irregularis DAOM 181602=DAOM 197198]